MEIAFVNLTKATKFREETRAKMFVR